MNTRKIKMSKTEDINLLLCNPMWLNPENISEQQEKSMCGQRTRFLKLHRYIDSLNDNELKITLKGVNEKFVDENRMFPNDIFTDTSILTDVLHHEIMIRDGYDVTQIEDVKKSYHYNVRIAEQFEEVTSDHMINEINKRL